MRLVALRCAPCTCRACIRGYLSRARNDKSKPHHPVSCPASCCVAAAFCLATCFGFGLALATTAASIHHTIRPFARLIDRLFISLDNDDGDPPPPPLAGFLLLLLLISWDCSRNEQGYGLRTVQVHSASLCLTVMQWAVRDYEVRILLGKV